MRIRPFYKHLHIRSALGIMLLMVAFETANAQTEMVPQKTSHLDNFGGREVSLGKPTAPLTIIMYYSLTCPHCHDFHKHQLPKIEKDFIDKGLVRFIFRDFPTDSFAIKAAKIAWCHGTKQYLSFAQKLLETQDKWVPKNATELKKAEDALHEIATKELWISDENYRKCLENHDIEMSILRSSFEAQKTYEIMGAPTFLINSEIHEGILDYEVIEKKLFEMKIFLDNQSTLNAPKAAPAA
jgi:protein-disulfide isomerase